MKVREATAVDAAAIARVHYNTWQTTFRGIIPNPYIDRASAGDEKRHHSCSPTA
jgi:hypothetical protein